MLTSFKLPPYKWQKEAISRSYDQQNLALLAEMGTGKSGATINILRARFKEFNRVRRTLILAPLVTLHNWKNEFGIHSHVKPNKIAVLTGNGSKDKLKKFRKACVDTVDKDKVVVVNYEALLSNTLYEEIKNWNPEILVCDEIHYCKNHKAKRSKKVAVLADNADRRYILTGTPILNNVSDIFMQYRILDGGRTFGDNFFVFKSKYMRDENEGWKGKPNYFPKWVPRPEKFNELQNKIYQQAIRVTKEECLDLPPLVQKTYPIELGKDQEKYYKQMQRDFLTWVKESEKQGIVVAQLAVTKALRLQQIASGFVSTDDGQIIEIKDNPRLQAVKQLLQDLHGKHKVILWCSFIHNYAQLARVCDDLGIEYVQLTGGMNGDAKQEAIEQFNNNPDTRVIIANRRAGGIGVNLVSASYSIVYSRNFSLEEELQSTARNYRGGSQIHERIVKIDLCAKDTIDETITEALLNKQDIANKIIDVIKEKS